MLHKQMVMTSSKEQTRFDICFILSITNIYEPEMCIDTSFLY